MCVLDIMTIGTNYGLNDEYTYYEFSFDSLDAKDTKNNTTSELNWPLYQIEPIQDIVGMKVIEADIPFSYYVFNVNNNTFLLKEDGTTIGGVVIEPGNYNSSTLIPVLMSALNTASTHARTYIVTYSSAQGKFSITASAGTFSFIFGNLLPGQVDKGNTNPRLWLGFPPGETFSAGINMSAPNVAMIEGPNYLYVNSSLGNAVDLWLPDNPQLLPNKGPQLAQVPVNTNKFGIINWQDPDPQKYFSTEIPLFSQIDFYITMGNDPRPLDFNGQPFHLKVALLVQNKSISIRQSGTNDQGHVTKRIRTI